MRDPIPPTELYNASAEKTLLSQAILTPTLFLTSGVQAADFGLLEHQEIWAAGLALWEKEVKPDLLPLADEACKRGYYKSQEEGWAALAKLLGETPLVSDPSGAIHLVLDYAGRRRASQAATALLMAASRDGPFEGALRDTVSVLQNVVLARVGPPPWSSADEVADFFGKVAWAWPGWVPAGHLTLLVGPQGAGKSYLAARLVGTLAGDLPTWPDGQPFEGEAGPVVICETEELRGVFVERLDRMGVNRAGYLFAFGLTHTPDLLKEDTVLEKLAQEQGARAIVVDSLSGAHRLDENKPKVRELLQRLAGMAARLRVPIVLVHHLRKKNLLEPVAVSLDRIRGSSTIPQFCRSVLAAYRLKEADPTAPVRLEAIKSTFCAPPKPLGFTIGDGGLEFGEAPELEKPESQLDRAIEFLQALLETGPVPWQEIDEERQGAGISEPTLDRAKAKLKIVARREGQKGVKGSGRWVWALPTVQK